MRTDLPAALISFAIVEKKLQPDRLIADAFSRSFSINIKMSSTFYKVLAHSEKPENFKSQTTYTKP